MILIKDAKMPECCADCPLIDFGPGCKIIGEIDADVTKERPEDCPLAEVVTCKDCKYNCGNYVVQSPINAIPIPEGVTNGDMIKTMFPNVECRENRLGNVFVISDAQLGYIVFRESWWNSPYKKGEKNA